MTRRSYVIWPLRRATFGLAEIADASLSAICFFLQKSAASIAVVALWFVFVTFAPHVQTTGVFLSGKGLMGWV